MPRRAPGGMDQAAGRREAEARAHQVTASPRTGTPRWWAAARRFRAAATQDRITDLAAEVAFYGFLGIFPGLLALAAALGFLENIAGADVAQQAERVVVDFLAGFLGAGASVTIEAVEALFEDSDTALLSYATAGAVWAMWRATRAALRALGVVYEVEESRSLVRFAGLALGVALSTLVLAALILTMFVVGPLFGGGRAIAELVGLGDAFAVLWTWARLPLAFGLVVMWATMLFRLTPHRPSSFRDELPGAVATGLLWLAFSAGFRVYLGIAGGTNQVLGVIGGVMTMLLWLYLLSLALLLGAELNAVIMPTRQLTAGGEKANRRWRQRDEGLLGPPAPRW